MIQGDFQAPNWLDLQRLHHNPFNIDTGGTALRLRWRWGPEQVQAFPERRLPPDEKHPDIARHPVGKVNNPRRKMETLRLQIMAPS